VPDPPTAPGSRPVLDPPTAPTVRLAHEVSGGGPPLLLIAGTGFPGATWRHDDLLRPLGERFTVITFDHRGTGDTPGTPGDYSVRLFAADALALLRELDLGPAHLVGHSMGGRVAQWMVLDGRDLVDSVVFAATGPGQFRHDQAVTRGIPVKTCLWMAEHGYEGYLRRHIPATFFTPEFAAAEPERVQWLVDAFWAHRPPLEDYLKHVIARQTHQSAHVLARMDVPSLVLVGDRDTHQGGTGSHWEQSRYLAAHLPDASFRSIPGAAHGYFWQAPRVTVAELLGWFATRSAPGCRLMPPPSARRCSPTSRRRPRPSSEPA
jgi:pimeloyl-ACP methyl ester carboxylesterase